jgi:DNA invertase Pin-like site-specific DNA recombinase
MYREQSRTDVRVSVLGYGSVRSPARIDDRDFARQEAIVAGFCQRRGWELVALLRDVEPRRIRTAWGRPSLISAIERLGRGEADCLVAAELRRLCPSIAELGWVLEAIDEVNGRLVSLDPALDTGNPIGRAVARSLVSVSDWERRRRAEMTSAARSKIPVPGSMSSGLRRRIVRLRGAGLTLQAIADMLNEEGVPTARGGATWRPSSVQAAVGYKRPAPWAIGERSRGSTQARRMAGDPV